MKRRDYIENISTAATAPLVLDSFIEASEETVEQFHTENSNAKDYYVFRRGERGEYKIIVEKYDEYDEPKVRILDDRGEKIHEIPRQKDTPFLHVGRHQTIVYKQPAGLRETVFLSYYSKRGSRVRGMWVTGDKAMSQQEQGDGE